MEIVINADDFGMNDDVNTAIAYCFKKNYIQSTSLMVNMPYAENAIKIAKLNGFINKVGLHLNLVQGKPLTNLVKKTRFCDKEGNFNGLLMKGKYRLLLTKFEFDALKLETYAQMDKFIELGCNFHHIDSHRHSHINLPVLKIIFDASKKYHFSTIRLARNIPNNKSFFKGIYKFLVNKKIKKFNKSKNGYIITNFGSIDDFMIFEHKSKNINNVVEIMVHPIMINGVLSDAINNISLEEWLYDREKK